MKNELARLSGHCGGEAYIDAECNYDLRCKLITASPEHGFLEAIKWADWLRQKAGALDSCLASTAIQSSVELRALPSGRHSE